MTIKPMRDLVLLRPLAPRLVSEGGILLVDRYQDDRMQWIVEATGPLVTEVSVGERVLTPLNFEHETLRDGRKLTRQGQLIMAWALNPNHPALTQTT